MNIVLINQFYPPDTAPTGRVLHDLAAMLARRGHRVDVVCSRHFYGGTACAARREILDGVRVHRVVGGGLGRHSAIGKLIDYAVFYVCSAAALASVGRHADLILALTTPPYIGLAAALVARLRRARHAHWIMDVYPDVLAAHGKILPDSSIAYRCLAALSRRELRTSALTFTLGPDMAERIRAYTSRAADAMEPRWLPLWGDRTRAETDGTAVAALRKRRGWEGEIVFMYSGNMGQAHRFGEFLQVALRAAELRPEGVAPPRFVFAGDGPRRKEIAAFAEAHPGAAVSLLPYIEKEKVSVHLRTADVMLASLDPRWQGCLIPSKLQAAFEVGRPVLFLGAEENSAARWIRESGGGWVVHPDDAEGLAAAVVEACDARKRAVRAAAAREFAVTRFNYERNAGRICDWIEQSRGAPRLNGRAAYESESQT